MLDSDESLVSPLSSLSVKDFVSSVASRTAVPGGGSVAALVGSVVTKLLRDSSNVSSVELHYIYVVWILFM